MNRLESICSEVTEVVFNSWVKMASESYLTAQGVTSKSREAYIYDYLIQEYEYYLEGKFIRLLSGGRNIEEKKET